jgi:hypothetical protein
MPKIIIVFISVLICQQAFAQPTKKDRKEERRQRINALIKQEEEGVINYRKHTLFGLKLTSDGYGAFLEVGRAQSIRKALLFQLDIAERKHPKEKKQSNQFQPTAPFIFGKINFFYPVKLGVQQQYLLGNKANKNGVAVTVNYGGGITLGLLRPYYLEITDNGTRRNIKYDSPDSLIFSSSSDLINRGVTAGSFGRGWGEIKLRPGFYAKSGLRFDYGRYNELVSAIEAGISAEYYTSKIPQLIGSKQQQLFMNLYVSILFGRRK